MKNNNIQYVILVVYYEKYFDKAMYELDKMINSLYKRFQIIVVSNNENIKNINDKDILIYSNDFSSEFAGYETGMQYLRDNNLLNFSNKDIIFVNDTYLYHRNWIKHYKLAFYKALKKLIKTNTEVFMGEIDKSKIYMEWNNTKFNYWVSSYFFIIPKRILLDKSFTFLLTHEEKSAVEEVTDNKIIWNNKTNKTLKQVINNWMDTKNKMGWIGSNSSADRRRRKVFAILSEYNLTVNMKNRNINIVDVFKYAGFSCFVSSFFIKKTRGLKARTNNLFWKIRKITNRKIK